MIKREKMIVLRKINFGDSDLILHAISSEGHKLGLLARGAKRSRKRFGGGVLEPTHHIEAVYSAKVYDASEDRLFILQEAQLLDGFVGIRKDYGRLELALHFLFLVDRVATVGMADSAKLYSLLGHALRSLETAKQLPILKLQFESKLLRQQGVLEDPTQFSALLTVPLSKGETVTLALDEISRLQNHLAAQVADYVGK